MLVEIIENGPQADGWIDITVVGSRHQEQYKAGTSPRIFRHRAIDRHFVEHLGDHNMRSEFAVHPAKPWIDGPAPDGSGRTWPAGAESESSHG